MKERNERQTKQRKALQSQKEQPSEEEEMKKERRVKEGTEHQDEQTGEGRLKQAICLSRLIPSEGKISPKKQKESEIEEGGESERTKRGLRLLAKKVKPIKNKPEREARNNLNVYLRLIPSV